MSGLTGGAYHPPGQTPHGNARGENAKPPPEPGPQTPPTNSLYLDDGDVRLYHGDALTVLRDLPPESVHMCVTSPPFFGLRDYQTGRWEDGNPDCDHETVPARAGRGGSGSPGKNTEGAYPSEYPAQTCGKCGAQRVDQQIGLEETPEQWVASLVAVFREVRRVLRDDGTLWLEVGDSYAAGKAGRTDHGSNDPTVGLQGNSPGAVAPGVVVPRNAPPGYKPKDLIGAPWALAFALRADGWYLRSDIVWARANPMPESVTDRPTKSHSYVFLLAKQPRYFFDAEAVREQNVSPEQAEHTARYAKEYHAHTERVAAGIGVQPGNVNNIGIHARGGNTNGRNVRSVWNIATQPYPEAHFATFPEELARRCILAGTSERGCCPECGASWVRQTEHEYEHLATRRTTAMATTSNKITTTLGWRPSCTHIHDDDSGVGEAGLLRNIAPCVVLDPFVGSGTVPFVARKHDRHSIGIDLSAQYLELASRRLQQLSLFA